MKRMGEEIGGLINNDTLVKEIREILPLIKKKYRKAAKFEGREVYYERPFCYEFYHQLRKAQNNNNSLISKMDLHGELPKYYRGYCDLFDLRRELEEMLDKGDKGISEELKKEFERKGFSLPQNSISMKENNEKWVITDEEKKKTYYTVRKEHGELKVCKNLNRTPDFIIHKQNRDKENLVVIEVKRFEEPSNSEILRRIKEEIEKFNLYHRCLKYQSYIELVLVGAKELSELRNSISYNGGTFKKLKNGNYEINFWFYDIDNGKLQDGEVLI